MISRVRQSARRLLRGELHRAIDALDDDTRPRGVRIHEMRTALKRARALLKLVRSLVGRRGREERRRLAAVARRFGALRDAEVAVETLDRLILALPGQAGVLSALRVRAVARWRDLQRRTETTADLRGASRALGLALRRVERLFRRAGEHVGRSVADGFAREYRKTRRAMKDAYELNTPEAFHAWRKGVKTHAYHLKVLTEADAKKMARRRDSLDALGASLGASHDLTVLEATIRAERFNFADPRACQRVLTIIETHRRSIHAKVKQLGRRLFGDRPSTMRRRISPRLL